MCPFSVSTATISRLFPTFAARPGKQGAVYAAIAECRAADNHLLRACGENAPRPCSRSDAAAYTHAHGGFAAELPHQTRIAAAPHGGVEIDHVQQRIIAEAIEQSENILHRQTQLAAANELHRPAALKIDARDDHCNRTGTPLECRKHLSSRSSCTAS